MKKKIKPIYQMSQNECGVCCLSMILRYYNVVKNNVLISEEVGMGRDGVSPYQIKKYLEKEEFQVRVFQSGIKALEKINKPAIITYQNNHFVILEEIENKKISIIDPIDGRKKISINEFKNNYTGYVIEAIPKFKKKNKRIKPIFIKLIKFCNVKRKDVLSLIIISLFAYITMLMIPITIQYIIDNIDNNGALNNLIVYCSIFICIYAFSFMLDNSRKIIFGNDIFKDLNQLFIRKILKIPFSYFQMYNEGDTLYKINSIAMIENLYTKQIIPIVFNIGIITIMLIYLFHKSYILTIILIIFLIMNGIIICIFQKNMSLLIKQTIKEATLLNNVLVETIMNIENIKILNMENITYKTWDKQFNKYNRINYKYRMLSSLYYGIINAGSIGIPLLLLIIGCRFLESNTLTLGTILGFYSTAAMLFQTESSTFLLFNEFTMSEQHLERVDEVLFHKDKYIGKEKISKKDDINISISNLSFQYSHNNKKVLKNINIDIPYGKMIAIVGASGSGKSTLFKLLCGLFDPTEGKIEFNGIELKQIDKNSFNEIVGIVPQNIQLFNKSIYDNLIMGNITASEFEVKSICKKVCLEEDINRMPMKYNTILNNSGNNLSGGQRQKISIAKALLKSPKVLLFDEATSFLDNISEKIITQELEKMGCTRIVIAHRLSTIKQADCIYVLENGEIIEKGNHNELIKLDGKYKKLYDERVVL